MYENSKFHQAFKVYAKHFLSSILSRKIITAIPNNGTALYYYSTRSNTYFVEETP
jgi:hypothetical protein